MAERITNLKLKLAAAVTLGPAAVLGGQACGGGSGNGRVEMPPAPTVTMHPPTADASVVNSTIPEPTKVAATATAIPTEAPKPTATPTEAPKPTVDPFAQTIFDKLKADGLSAENEQAIESAFIKEWSAATTPLQKATAYASICGRIQPYMNEQATKVAVGNYIKQTWPQYTALGNACSQ